MNWTCKLLAVAFAAVAFFSLDFHARSTLDSQLNKAREELKLFSLESMGACNRRGGGSSGSGEPYDVAEAYQVYSVIISKVSPNPETNTWFIGIDTLPIDRWMIRHANNGNRQGARIQLWMTTSR